MDLKQLLNDIIYPVVEVMGFDKTPEAKKNIAMLLLYTCQQESRGGHYVRQIRGPALGIMQMEPFTFNDIFNNYIRYRPSILSDLDKITQPGKILPEHMVYNLFLSVAMARLQYRRSPLAVPRFDDKEKVWQIYKSAYNSHLGAATRPEFVHNISIVDNSI